MPVQRLLRRCPGTETAGMEQCDFFPFSQPLIGDYGSLSLLTNSMLSLISLPDAAFVDVLVSKKFRQFLDTFLRYSWYVSCHLRTSGVVAVSQQMLSCSGGHSRCAGWLTPCRRPHDQVLVPQTSRTFTEWLQLRQQVLDVLWRAHSVQGNGSSPVLHELDLSAASSIDICALYAFDEVDTCSSIMQALLHKKSLQGGMAITFCVQMILATNCCGYPDLW